MATFDSKQNLGYGTVLTAPSPANSGLSLTLNAGQGALFTGTPPYNCVVWPAGPFAATLATGEIVRVTGRVGDVLTITRTQEGTAARTILVGDQFANVPTVLVFQQLQDAINAIVPGTGDVVGPASATDGRPALFDGITGKLLKQAAAALGSAAFVATSTFDAAGAAAAAQSASQPVDPDLTAIAALTTTSYGRSFLELANAAAARVLAGAVIGTNVQAFSAVLDQIVALSPSNDDIIQRKAGAWVVRTIAQYLADLQGTGASTTSSGFRGVPQTSVSADRTVAAGDNGTHWYHPSADTTARTWTIPADGSVPLPVGFVLTLVNDASAGVVTIAITSDTLVLAGAGTTGSRTLAANGVATMIKMTSTRWQINGTGLI